MKQKILRSITGLILTAVLCVNATIIPCCADEAPFSRVSAAVGQLSDAQVAYTWCEPTDNGQIGFCNWTQYVGLLIYDPQESFAAADSFSTQNIMLGGQSCQYYDMDSAYRNQCIPSVGNAETEFPNIAVSEKAHYALVFATADQIAKMTTDNRYQIIGIVKSEWNVPMYFDPVVNEVVIEFEEDAAPKDTLMIEVSDSQLAYQSVQLDRVNDSVWKLTELAFDEALWNKTLRDGMESGQSSTRIALEHQYRLYTALTGTEGILSIRPLGSYPCGTEQAEYSKVTLIPIEWFGTGDLNGDGKTNIGDAVALARFNAEDSELDTAALNLDEADLNADGTVDSLDLAEMLESLADSGE